MTILELHQCRDGPKVKLFYFNKTESLPISGKQYKINSCPQYDCPYNTFTSFISKYFPNYEKECGIPADFDPYPVLEKWLTITDSNNTYNP